MNFNYDASPSKKVLIIVDVQNDFVTGSLGTKEAQAIIPNVINKIKSFKNGSIIFTYDTHYSNYLLSTLEGHKLPIKHCIKDTNGWYIVKNVYDPAYEKANSSSKNDLVEIEKETFGFIKWEEFIDPNDEVEIVGLCTDICVISNALILRALYPNMIIKVDASCCAGVTLEKHKAALEVMKSCQIDVINEIEEEK